MRAATAGAAHVHGARNTPRGVRRRRQSGIAQPGGHVGADFLGLQLFADLGADAPQVGTGGLGVALAEGQLHAHFGVVGHGHGLAGGVQADDVAHHYVVAEVAGAAHGVTGLAIGRVHQADQGGAHGGQGVLGLVQRHLQVAQQHVECGLAVELQQHVAVHRGDGVHRRHRQAALGDARYQLHVRGECHARQAAAEHAAGSPMALDVAVAAHRELHGAPAPG